MHYFAVSLPDFVVFEGDLNQHNRIHCHYMMAPGKPGMGDGAGAEQEFDTVPAEQPDHPGAVIHRTWINNRRNDTSMTLKE